MKKADSNKNIVESNSINLEDIIALLPGHIYWKDRNGVLLGCNDEQARDMGLNSREDIVGLTAHNTLPKELADAITHADNEIMTSGTPQTIEEVLKLPGRKKSIWLSRKIPLRNEQEEVIGILGISLDITEIKRVKRKLHATKLKLEGMTAISASIAHELRTPLATLDIATDNIRSPLPALMAGYKAAKTERLSIPEISDRQIDSMNDSLDNMKREIRAAFTCIDMLLANLRPNISAKSDETFAVSSCISDTVARYPFQEGERELVAIDNKFDFNIQGNQELVSHVLFNLMKNALYYLAAAGRGEISISTASEDKYNKLLFKDTGTGIAKAVLPRVFKRFFSKTHNGAGIGLTFCKLVMKSLDGNVTCESVEHEYTLFTLYFPRVT